MFASTRIIRYSPSALDTPTCSLTPCLQYGDENDAYEYAAKNATSSEILVASVGISEWGEKENQDLADRFGVKKEDWPRYIFFPKGSKEGVTFSGNKKDTYAILQFIRKQVRFG